MRIFIIATIFFFTMFNSCKKKNNNSSLLGTSVSYHGVMKNHSEIQEGLEQLSLHTQHWLKNRCRDYLLQSQCVPLSWDLEGMSEQEKNRLWLANLLEAKQRANYEGLGVKLGVHTSAISHDINELSLKLGPEIEKLNQAFFTRYIGKRPYELQTEYLTSLENIDLLISLNRNQSDAEIRSHMSLLKTINKELVDNEHLVYGLYRDIILTTQIAKAKRRDSTLIQSAMSIYLDIIRVYEERTDEAARGIYESLKKTNGETFAEIYQTVLAQMDRINYLEVNTETVFQNKFMRALHDKYPNINTLDASSSTNFVKWGLASFLGFHKSGALYSVVLSVGIVAMALGDFEFKKTDQVLDFAVSFGFMIGYVEGLAKVYGSLLSTSYSQVKQRIISSWASLSNPGSKLYAGMVKHVAGFVDNWIGTTLDFLKPVATSICKFITTVVTISSVAMFMSTFFSIYSSVVNWKQWSSYKKAMHTINSAIFLTNLGLGLTAAVIKVYATSSAILSAVPVINIICAVGGAVALVVAVLNDTLNKPLDVKVDDNSPEVKFYKSGINPAKTYWSLCSEDLGSGESCSQDFYSNQFLGRSKNQERIILGGEFGGPGGSYIHKHHSIRSYVKLDDQISLGEIDSVQIYTCARGRQLGLRYNYRESRGKFFHMGCGSESSDRENLKELKLNSDESINSMTIYHAQHSGKSRRIYKLKICSNKERCVENSELLSKKYYQRSVVFDNFAEYKFENGRNVYHESGRGKIVGFHGKFGDSIDTIGPYVRLRPSGSYKRELLDNNIEWYHERTQNSSGLCVQKGRVLNDAFGVGSRNRPELSDLFDAIQGERGRCECNKYFNIVENDAIFGMSASCYE